MRAMKCEDDAGLFLHYSYFFLFLIWETSYQNKNLVLEIIFVSLTITKIKDDKV